MKVLIVYDSVSASKMTAKVAETIWEVLKGKGLEVEKVFVKEAGQTSMENYDCVLIGSPTMAWRPTKDTMNFLDKGPVKVTKGKMAATFDTQIESRLSGDANKHMVGKLTELGFEIAIPPLHAYVKGKKDNYQFKEGEQEKIKNWALDVAKALQGKS